VRPKDEKALIEQAKHRDPEAISELYNRNVDAIYRYISFRVNDSVTAEDITAEVFLKALESIEGYTDTGLPFSAWLFKIAHARVIDHWRRGQRRPQVELDESLPSEEDGLPAPGAGMENADLNQAINLLNAEQQQVVVLKFQMGLSNEEISHIMGKTEGAIKALQHRALASLARILEKQT
jgi:RNA polymerase sigma-70 factor (ECF subfamily)